MRIEIRPVGRLRGADQAASAEAVASVLRAAGDSGADLETLRVVVDWIQYGSSFREIADLRPILAARPADGALPAGARSPEQTGSGDGVQAGLELAVDLRRAVGGDLGAAVAALLPSGGVDGAGDGGGHGGAGGRAGAGSGGPGGSGAGSGGTGSGGTSSGGDGSRGGAGSGALGGSAPRSSDTGGGIGAGGSAGGLAVAGKWRADALVLEPWGAGTASLIWRFNALYWQALSHWEQATGREYELALPGGTSDARNTSAVRELILELFKIWDDLDARGALPAELYVVELGVGNGSQAKVWLDEFVALSSAHRRDYYRRLHYLMGDYSPHVLSRARQAVAHHGEHVTSLVVDATHPAVSLGFLRGKAFLVYISNVYDNLPTDEVARIGGRSYQVQVRAVLPAAQARRIARHFGARPAAVPGLIAKLLRLGPEHVCDALPQHFTEPPGAVEFWRQAWSALRLQERYVPIEGLDSYRIGPDLTGEMLRSQLETGDIRVHVNNGALNSFADTLPLLHPFGRLTCHDLFVTDVSDYLTRFHGPGKYDGSIVNWVNGPLLRHVGGRAGFDVRIAPFAQRPNSNVSTLTAAVRE